MKKVFISLSTAATFTAAVALTACNNAEEVKKKVEEQNATIQTLVDEKLNALTEQVNTECSAKIDSLATAAYTAWQEEEAKATKGKKPVAKKPAAKPTPAPEAPKTNPKEDRFKDPNGGKVVTKEQTEQKGDRFKDPNAAKTVTPEDTKKKGDRFKDPK